MISPKDMVIYIGRHQDHYSDPVDTAIEFITDCIGLWYESDTTEECHTYLGFTFQEYGNFVMNSEAFVKNIWFVTNLRRD